MKTRSLAAVLCSAALVLSGCIAGGDDAAKASEAVETPIDLGDDSMEVLGVYTIQDDDTINGATDEEEAVFERFAEVIPAEYRPEVSHFVSISQEDSDGVDGAMQHPDNEDGEQIFSDYYLALDTTGSSTGETLDRTIVHEFAHLLTLRESQLTLPAEGEDLDDLPACPVYETPECPAEDSYLMDYFSQFEYAEPAEYDPEVYATEYAATIPTEDVAEVFAEWVLSDEGNRTVTDDDVTREVEPGSILDQKFDFFDSYPELVTMREDIRAGLAS